MKIVLCCDLLIARLIVETADMAMILNSLIRK